MGMRSSGFSGGFNDGGWRTSRSDHGDNWCKFFDVVLKLFLHTSIIYAY